MRISEAVSHRIRLVETSKCWLIFTNWTVAKYGASQIGSEINATQKEIAVKKKAREPHEVACVDGDLTLLDPTG